MATSSVVPVSEYLSTVYRPDCDYVDGEVQERNLGEIEHGNLQAQLLDLLRAPANRTYLQAIPEVRVQISETRFRIPDVCVRRVPVPQERIVRTPPLLCIEILSPEDRVSRVRERVHDFLTMGVPEVWLVDPATHSISVYAGVTMVEHTTGALTVPETPVLLALADIFKVLDES